MGSREYAKVTPRRRDTEEIEALEALTDQERVEADAVIEDIDDLLEEIDTVLEEQSVLVNFRQRSGQ